MMFRWKRSAKANIGFLVILALVIVAIGVSLVVIRQARRKGMSAADLKAGNAAFDARDWKAAVENYRDYLRRKPDDLAVLRKYALACLSARPLESRTLAGAISAYRRITQLDPNDGTAYEKLAMLYGGMSSFEDLATLARARMERDPNDLKAPLWLADALNRVNKKAEARQTLEAFMGRLAALPGQHPEYVQACVQMSELAPGAGGSAPRQAVAQQATALDWLNRAAAYAPGSAEVLLSRAQLYRRMADTPGASEKDRVTFLSLGRKDIEAADASGTEDPRIRYALGVEWMSHGELDRAAAELQAADKLPEDKLTQRFFDLGDWTAARFLLGSELAMRKGAAADAAALADATLAALKPEEKRQRGRVLPAAVRVYVTAGKSAEAKRCLDEYLTLVQGQQVQASSARTIAALKALVEAAENRPYAVIDLLEPLAGNEPNNPQMLLMLARAYGQTGQARRAVAALEQYRRLSPQDRQAAGELARQYARTGDFQKAFDLASEAESASPADIDLKLLRIGAAISRTQQQGTRANASTLKTLATELSGLRQQHSDRVDIRIFQSIIADALGEPQQAEQELKQAIAECKEPFGAELQLARRHVGAGRMEDALGVCEASCARRKDVAEPWIVLCDLCALKQDYDAARRGLQRGLEAVTNDRDKKLLSAKLAMLELSRGDRPAGLRILKELVKDPQEIRARLLLLGSPEIRQDPNEAGRLIGELRKAEGERGLWWRLYQASLWLAASDAASKQKDVADLLQYCVKADPTWPAPVLLLAQMYTRQREVKQAEDIYRRGLLGNPSSTEIADGLLNLLVGQSRFADAEKVLKQIQNPQIAADWRVRLAVGTGDFSGAMEELKLRISNDKQDAASRVELARLTYRETKDTTQAMRYLDEAKAIAPNSRTLAAVRAFIFKAEGKPAEALRVLDEYVADYNNFEAYWMRAAYLVEMSLPERAEQDYRKLTTFKENAAEGYTLLANFYAGLGKLDPAVTAVEEGLRTRPDDARLQRSLMGLLLSRRQGPDKERALALLAELEKQSPDDTALLMTRATLKIEEATPQSIAEAGEILEAVVKREPTAINGHLALIGIATRERDQRKACDLAVRALSSNPNDASLLLARARAELALGYAAVAAKLARQILQQDPNSLEALSVFAQAAPVSGDRNALQEAGTLLDAAVRRNPADERSLMLQSRFVVASGQPQAAIPGLEAYCQGKEGSGNLAVRVTLADLYRIVGDAARADAAIKQLEQSDPDKQIVVHARFLWLASQKRWEDLKQVSSSYLKAKDQDLAAVMKAASTLMSSGRPELKGEGLKLLEHAASTWPTSVEARLNLASTLYAGGDAERAEKLCREVLAQYPNEVQALNNLAWIMQERYQRHDAALELANKGLKLAPDNTDLLDTRGTILANLPNRLTDARSDFARLADLLPANSPERARALLQLARICGKLRDSAQARQRVQEALEIDGKVNVFTAAERSEIAEIIKQASR